MPVRRIPPQRMLCSKRKEMPAAVRWVVVGSGVSVATPLFPVIGLYRLVCYLVPDGTVRVAIFGTCGAIVSFALRDLLPVLVEHAEFLAPFALANGLVASAAYALVEAAAGGPVALLGYASHIFPLAPASVVGAGVGAITALAAPYTYSSAVSLFWGIDLELRRFMDPMIIPVSIPTGLVAGAALGPLVRPAFLASAPWTVSLVVFAPLAACFYLYRRAIWFDAEPLDPLTPGRFLQNRLSGQSTSAYLSDDQRQATWSIVRANAATGKMMSSVPNAEGAIMKSDDGKLAESGHLTRHALEGAIECGVNVFDDRRSARLDAALRRMEFLEYFIRENLRPIESLAASDLKQKSALATDAVARLAYKLQLNPATPATAAAEEVIHEFQPFVDLMRQRNLDENPSSRHLENPLLLSAAAADALGLISLLQNYKKNIAVLDPEDVAAAVELRNELTKRTRSSAQISHSEGDMKAKLYAQRAQQQQLINYAELETLLENADVALPLTLWLDFKRRTKEAETKSRRRRSLATAALLLLLYFYSR